MCLGRFSTVKLCATLLKMRKVCVRVCQSLAAVLLYSSHPIMRESQ